MQLFAPWKLSKNYPNKKLKFYSSTINNMTTYTQKITFHTNSSMINTTQKDKIIIRNKIFISLSISLILIILCISLSYCIFIYLQHCLNTNSIIKQDILELNRVSYTNSEDSNEIRLQICKTKDDILLEAIDKTNDERRSSTDSVKLFRY
jgi:hypothetical protein